MRTKFIRNTVEAENTQTFYFQKPIGFTYMAGQFIDLTLKLPTTSTDKNHRWFTLSSSPTEPELAITTRINSKPLSDFKQTLTKLEPDQVVSVSQAMGDFVAPKDHSIHLTFVAIGIGVTPFRSIIKQLIDASQDRTITIIHSVRNRGDMLFSNTFKQYGCTVHHTYQDSSEQLNAERIVQLQTSGGTATRMYLAGPEPVVEKLTKELLDTGYPESQLQTDYFPGYVQ